MKKFLLMVAVLPAILQSSFAQWSPPTATSGPISYVGGNVGIGTATPAAALDIAGLLQLSSTNTTTPPPELSYGLFPYGGIGLGIFSGATLATQGIGIWTNPGGIKTEVMRIQANGNVGIGTTSPTALLDVESSGAGVTSLVKSVLNTAFSQFQAQNDNGANAAFHHAVFGSTYSGTLFGASLANSATLYANGANISGMLIGTKNPTSVTIGTNNAAAVTILSGGYVGIGTTSPDALLAVKGTIHTQEVKVDMAGWGDDVFKSTYKLPTLTEVKNYIGKNHHLPDMPSEEEVVKNGIQLSEMLKLQQKKIEELTLYLIDKDKQLADQEKHIRGFRQRQNKRIATLEAAITKLTIKKTN